VEHSVPSGAKCLPLLACAVPLDVSLIAMIEIERSIKGENRLVEGEKEN
jgi:hypothetical protein